MKYPIPFNAKELNCGRIFDTNYSQTQVCVNVQEDSRCSSTLSCFQLFQLSLKQLRFIFDISVPCPSLLLYDLLQDTLYFRHRWMGSLLWMRNLQGRGLRGMVRKFCLLSLWGVLFSCNFWTQTNFYSKCPSALTVHPICIGRIYLAI